MGFFAYDITDGSDPRIRGMFGVVQPCSRQTAPVTREESYQCGANKLNVSEYESFPTTWQSTPNNTQDGVQYYVYRDKEKSRLYAFAAPSNETMLVRLWMGDPSIKSFTEIYRNTGGVRIYEFRPDAI